MSCKHRSCHYKCILWGGIKCLSVPCHTMYLEYIYIFLKSINSQTIFWKWIPDIKDWDGVEQVNISHCLWVSSYLLIDSQQSVRWMSMIGPCHRDHHSGHPWMFGLVQLHQMSFLTQLQKGFVYPVGIKPATFSLWSGRINIYTMEPLGWCASTFVESFSFWSSWSCKQTNK